MRVRQEVWSACTLNSPTPCITNSEVGSHQFTVYVLLLFVVCAAAAIYNFVCMFVPDRLLPGQRGALWLCMMQYCDSCTSPRTPEYLLYLYHTHLHSLAWRHLHPDTQLMEQFFNVRHSSLRPLAPNTAHWPTLAYTCITQGSWFIWDWGPCPLAPIISLTSYNYSLGSWKHMVSEDPLGSMKVIKTLHPHLSLTVKKYQKRKEAKLIFSLFKSNYNPLCQLSYN